MGTGTDREWSRHPLNGLGQGPQGQPQEHRQPQEQTGGRPTQAPAPSQQQARGQVGHQPTEELTQVREESQERRASKTVAS